jgi:hypothetical protein
MLIHFIGLQEVYCTRFIQKSISVTGTRSGLCRLTSLRRCINEVVAVVATPANNHDLPDVTSGILYLKKPDGVNLFHRLVAHGGTVRHLKILPQVFPSSFFSR